MVVKHDQIKIVFYKIGPDPGHIVIISGIDEMNSRFFKRKKPFFYCLYCLVITIAVRSFNVSALDPLQIFSLQMHGFIYSGEVHNDDIFRFLTQTFNPSR